jgi:hypothetical protein
VLYIYIYKELTDDYIAHTSCQLAPPAHPSDQMQVDQPLPAAAAHGPTNAKVSGFPPLFHRWRVAPASRSGRAGLPDLSAPAPASCLVVHWFPRLTVRKSAAREARLGLATCPCRAIFSWEKERCLPGRRCTAFLVLACALCKLVAAPCFLHTGSCVWSGIAAGVVGVRVIRGRGVESRPGVAGMRVIHRREGNRGGVSLHSTLNS